MSDSIRYQVFVSSTFTDLKDERAEVIQALWELDCIPTGMEAFVASNESQWEVIKKVIDDSDYYVLIIGGRYGSVTPEGISYTEKEFRYARELGLPVLAFVHSNPDQIPVGKVDSLPANRERLVAFKKEVMEAYPIGKWLSASDLGSAVSRAVIRAIRTNPRLGWIKNNGQSRIELLEKIAEITAENQNLKALSVEKLIEKFDDTLEHGEDKVTVWGMRNVKIDWLNTTVEEWEANTTWDEMFRDIGPALLSEATEFEIRKIIAGYNFVQEREDGAEVNNATLADNAWGDVLVQFRALGLIEPGSKKRPVSDKGSYWKLTPRGDRHLVSLLAKRRGCPEPESTEVHSQV